jgi:hypothetical protein
VVTVEAVLEVEGTEVVLVVATGSVDAVVVGDAAPPHEATNTASTATSASAS